MKRKRYSDEKTISILNERQAGMKMQGLVRKYGVSEQSVYRWRAKFGGMDCPMPSASSSWSPI